MDLREKVQQGKSDQTILNRYNATLSQITEHENNKQRLSFKHFKKLMQKLKTLNACEIANARDLKTWSKTKNITNSITSLKVGDSVQVIKKGCLKNWKIISQNCVKLKRNCPLKACFINCRNKKLK